MRLVSFLGLATVPALVHSFAPTDSIQDVDPAQSGYLPNHNIDPNIVNSTQFGTLWKNTYNANEVFYAKQLVYTPTGYTNEMVIAVSNQNIIRLIDGATGSLLFSRKLDPPFQAADTACGDMPNTVGITGTPIIDPDTDIMYFFSKGYKNGAPGPQGTLAGQYKFYAVHLPTLNDVTGFPVIMDGNYAANDPTRYFLGGTHLQRPSLTSVGNVIVAGFGGHCDNFNYTGMLVTVTKTTGATQMYAMEASPGAPSPQPLLYTTQSGGKAAIWQTGMGMPTVGNQVYFVTGNGEGAANGAVPASGRLPLSTLDQCVANFNVDPNSGALSQTDYFEPYEYFSLNGGDRDFGSSGSAMLDPATFSGTGVDRIIVAGGKSGKIYIMNANNLGGFAQGPGGSDNVIQTILAGNPMFSGVGSYPLEGGYIYFSPTGGKLYAYKFGKDSSGKPLFTLAGSSVGTSAGVGVPTITSFNGKPGTGIVWFNDQNQGLVAYNPIPINGVLVKYTTIPALGGLTKYTRPAFGNGRLYVSGGASIFGLGVVANAAPVTCSPVSFGAVTDGQTSTAQVTCTAKTALTLNYCATTLSSFTCQNSSLPATVASGASFSFPVVFSATQPTVRPGLVTSLLVLNLATSTSTTDTNVQLSATLGVAKGNLVVNAPQIDFGGIVLGSSTTSVTKTLTLTNTGGSALSFTGFAWQDTYVSGMPSNTISVQSTTTVGNGFTAAGFPAVGSSLAAGASISISVTFSANAVGSWGSLLTLTTNNGAADVLLTGTAGNPPVGVLSISDGNGGWLSGLSLSFGNVLSGQNVQRQIRLCNTGASSLSITQSTPPVGAQLTALDPLLDLRQGSTIDVGACAYGTVELILPSLQPNHPSIPLSAQWVINTNGWTIGPQTISITATIVSREVGPQTGSTGTYQYLGCYLDSTARNLNVLTAIANSSIEACMSYCGSFNPPYGFAGVEYHTQCWCGNVIAHPGSFSPERDCNFACVGDPSESCGGSTGNNGYIYVYYDTNLINPNTVLPGSSSTTFKATSTSLPVSTSSKSSSVISTSSIVSSSSVISSSSKITSSSALSSSSSTPLTSTTRSSSSSVQSSSTIGTSSLSVLSSSSSSSSSKISSSSILSSSSITSSPLTSSSSIVMSSSVLSSSSTVLSLSSTILVSPPPSSTSVQLPSSSSSFTSSSSSSIASIVSISVSQLLSSSSSIGFSSSSSSLLLSSSPSSIPVSSTTSQTTGSSSSLPISSTLTSTGLSTTSSSLLSSSTSSLLSSSSTTASSSFVSSVTSSSTSSAATPSISLNPMEPAIVGNFSYNGCFHDLVGGARSLPLNVMVNPLMTLEMCAQNCNAYEYFGTEYQTECYCGYTLSPDLRALESDCNSPCGGNSSEICGTGARLSTYTNNYNIPPPPPPGHVAVAPVDFQWLSCYTEATNGRALTGPSFAADSMTVEACTSFCSGYAYAGVEYARECYCGNAISAGAVSTSVSDCNFLCKGNSSEYCGAGNRLDMYQYNPPAAASSGGFGIAGFSSSAMPSSVAPSAALTSSSIISSASPSISVALSSSSTISSAGFGVNDFSSSVQASSSSTTSSWDFGIHDFSSVQTSSSTPTTFSTISILPSSSHNVVSSLPSQTPTTGPSSNYATTTSSTPISTSILLASTTPGTAQPSAYTHLGCFQDLAKHHVLPLLFTNNSVTPELCAAYVQSLAHKPTPTILPYFAVEYHNECYGGTSLNLFQSSATSLYGRHACTDVCAGSIGAKATGTAMCGGRKQFNLYASGEGVGFSAQFTKSV